MDRGSARHQLDVGGLGAEPRSGVAERPTFEMEDTGLMGVTAHQGVRPGRQAVREGAVDQPRRVPPRVQTYQVPRQRIHDGPPPRTPEALAGAERDGDEPADRHLEEQVHARGVALDGPPELGQRDRLASRVDALETLGPPRRSKRLELVSMAHENTPIDRERVAYAAAQGGLKPLDGLIVIPAEVDHLDALYRHPQRLQHLGVAGQEHGGRVARLESVEDVPVEHEDATVPDGLFDEACEPQVAAGPARRPGDPEVKVGDEADWASGGLYGEVGRHEPG